MSRQEDLAYVEYEPFERDRPDMIAISEEKVVVVELSTGRWASKDIFQQMMWMKERKEEFYRKISKRQVEFLLVIPKLKRDIKEKLEKEGIKVLERPMLSF